ncbi:MAG: DUF2249 domain-containing protein [Fimbriimonadaceae bacterium]|nr:DUF2249 domain-containing protein [Alphaproteobacteria bacterium]
MSEEKIQPPVAGDIPVITIENSPGLDLRQVTTPPKPMVAVVELISRPDIGNIVHILMSRDPINLYPELTECGWSWSKEFAEDGTLRLTLTR